MRGAACAVWICVVCGVRSPPSRPMCASPLCVLVFSVHRCRLRAVDVTVCCQLGELFVLPSPTDSAEPVAINGREPLPPLSPVNDHTPPPLAPGSAPTPTPCCPPPNFPSITRGPQPCSPPPLPLTPHPSVARWPCGMWHWCTRTAVALRTPRACLTASAPRAGTV